MKLIPVALLLLAAVGCGGPCHDLVEHKYILGVPVTDVYYECAKGCCKQPPKNPRDCSCSDKCPCWPRHAELTKIALPNGHYQAPTPQ